MVYLLTYDGYMKEEKLQEICPSAILFMQCGLKDCVLEFRRFYETAMPTLEVGDEIVPAVIWKLEESDLKNMEAQGVEILTCGTCLDYYNLKDKLAVGSVTNMYTIVEKLANADKIIKQ